MIDLHEANSTPILRQEYIPVECVSAAFSLYKGGVRDRDLPSDRDLPLEREDRWTETPPPCEQNHRQV